MQARSIRNLVVICLTMAMSYTSIAQHASRIYVEPNGWSIGTSVGLSDMWGDVGTKSFSSHYMNSKYFDRVAFMGGMFGRYSVHPCFAVRFSANFGSLFATDAWNYDLALVAKSQGEDAYQRYARSQTAKAVVMEGTVGMEFIPFRSNPESKAASRRGQPWIGLGIGYFHYTPYSSVAASPRYVKTYELHLEGQGFGVGFPPSYSLWAPCFPLTIGYRWDLGQHLNLGLEYSYRITMTDYLDGVSGKYIDKAAYGLNMAPKEAYLAEQVADKGYYAGLAPPNGKGNMRGNPGNKDSYSTFAISFYYKVFTRTRQWWH